MTGLFTDILPVRALTSFISEGDLSRLATDPFQTSIFCGIVYIYSVCKKIDPNAFINTMSTSRVIGCFYLRPVD